MTTKADFINEAYTRGRISGLTRQPTTKDIKKALKRLENMASRWEAQNICTGYNFEDVPGINSKHNVPRQYWDAFESNLMMQLLADFGKQATPALAMTASSSFAWMQSQTATPRMVNYPSTMPIGKGNRRRAYWRNFFPSVVRAPNNCETVKMVVDNVNNYYEDFSAYLDEGETIASAVITADTGLTISNESVSSPRVNYTVTATGATDDFKALYQVVIVMTTDSTPARIKTRLRNFELTEIEID